MKFTTARNVISVVTMLSALVACGGGGGDSASNNTQVVATTPTPVATPTPPVTAAPAPAPVPAAAPTPTPVPETTPVTTTPIPVPDTTSPVVPSTPVIPPVITYSTTDAQIIADVASSNIDYSPGFLGRAVGTWRWQGASIPRIAVYIPPPSNTQEQNYADKVKSSITLINLKLNGLLVLEATNSPVATNYIQISYNTSYVPSGFTDYKSGNYCANVSTAPYSGNPINPDWQNGISSVPVYLNLGNGQCEVTQDIVTHEFGHALGLENHFNGFGIGSAISDEYWDTLATLYGNPQSTPAANIAVKRVSK